MRPAVNFDTRIIHVNDPIVLNPRLSIQLRLDASILANCGVTDLNNQQNIVGRRECFTEVTFPDPGNIGFGNAVQFRNANGVLDSHPNPVPVGRLNTPIQQLIDDKGMRGLGGFFSTTSPNSNSTRTSPRSSKTPLLCMRSYSSMINRNDVLIVSTSAKAGSSPARL